MREALLDRDGIDVRLETRAQPGDGSTGPLPWLATLSYFDAVYAEVLLAWLTPAMPPADVADALAAVGISGPDLRSAVSRAAALDRSAIVVGLVEPGPATASLLHHTLAAYAVCEATGILRAGSVWAARDRVSGRVRGLLGMRGRNPLPSADAATVAAARDYVAGELFGTSGARAAGPHAALRVVVGGRGA